MFIFSWINLIETHSRVWSIFFSYLHKKFRLSLSNSRVLKGRGNKIQCDRSTWRTKNEIVFMLALLFCCCCCCLWIIVLCICLFFYHLMYLKYFKTGNDGWNKLVPLYPIQWSKLFKSERLVPPMIWIGNFFRKFLENSWKSLELRN